jgi:hypothetical protein
MNPTQVRRPATSAKMWRDSFPDTLCYASPGALIGAKQEIVDSKEASPASAKRYSDARGCKLVQFRILELHCD